MTFPGDPIYPREMREEDQEGVTRATIVSIVIVLLLFGGVGLWAWYSEPTTTASVQRPGVERSMPPATTGQGGPASKMPAKDAGQ